MPQFGEKISNFDFGNSFIRLSNVGDKLIFRLVRNPDAYVFEAKHFMKDGDRWLIESCPRIMIDKDCIYCNQYLEIIKPRKELKKQQKETNDKVRKAELQVQIDEIETEARPYKAGVKMYYPVLDRETGVAGILETSQAVRGELEAMFEEGVDVYNFDFILTRKAKQGAGTWSLTRRDSTESKELTPAEKREYDKASGWNMNDLTGVGKMIKDLKLLHAEEETAKNPTKRQAAARKEEAAVVNDPIEDATANQRKAQVVDDGHEDMVKQFEDLGE